VKKLGSFLKLLVGLGMVNAKDSSFHVDLGETLPKI
jgi:hypothetical protein